MAQCFVCICGTLNKTDVNYPPRLNSIDAQCNNNFSINSVFLCFSFLVFLLNGNSEAEFDYFNQTRNTYMQQPLALLINQQLNAECNFILET